VLAPNKYQILKDVLKGRLIFNVIRLEYEQLKNNSDFFLSVGYFPFQSKIPQIFYQVIST
jgi:hypothetical protein